MAATTSLRDFEHFFGGDKKGAYLVQAMFSGTDYTKSNSPNSGLMCELMRAENYKNYQNTRSATNQVQGPEDVPQDVTDLIINAALFHRSIDKSSTAGTNLGMAITTIISAMKAFFATTMKSTVGERYFGSTSAFDTRYWPDDLYKPTTYADLYMYIAADSAMWEALNHPTTPQRLHSNTHRMVTSIFECDNTNPNENSLCISSFLKPPRGLPANMVGLSANVTLTKLATASGGQVKADDIRTAIVNKMMNSFKQIIVVMKQEILSRYPTLSATGAGIASVKEYMNVDNRTRFANIFLEHVVSDVQEGVRYAVTSVATVPHTTLAEPAAKTFFDAVYGKWSTLHSDIRNFYLHNVALFANTNATQLYDANNNIHRDQTLKLDWIRLTDIEVNTLFASGPITNTDTLGNLRVNLMKNNMTKVLFSSNLPVIPEGATVWYTQKTGAIDQVKPQCGFLRDLYESVYSTGITTGIVSVADSDGSSVELKNVENDLAKRSKAPFNLNLGKFTAAAIKREDDISTGQNQNSQTVNPDSNLELDYPFLSAYDMVYGKLWTFDMEKQQYYRLDTNNRKVYYNDDAKSDVKTCYASYLGKDEAGCKRVIECIFDGDSKSLNRCLDVIGDESLWNVAADDVQKVGPDMVKAVLRKFGVTSSTETDSNGAEYRDPMSFDTWKKTVVAVFADDVKKAILSNDKLLKYLQGLIGVCKSNPNILNTNIESIIVRDTLPEYIRNLNMQKYKIPHVTRRTQYQFFADSLRNAVQPHIVTQDMFNPIINGSMSNAQFYNPMSAYGQRMMGGAGPFYPAINPSLQTRGTAYNEMDAQSNILANGSVSMFRNLLGIINNAFADTGLQLHKDDQAKLTAVVAKMERYENQLARMCTILINIVKIARFYDIGLQNVDKDHPRVLKLSDHNTIEEIRDIIRMYKTDLTKTMVANMTVQQAAAYELVHKVTPRLLDESTGRSAKSAKQYHRI